MSPRKRSRSGSKSPKSHKRTKKDTGEVVDVDFSKNLYYVDGKGNVMQNNRSSHKKKKVGKVDRKPGFMYQIYLKLT